MTEIGLQSNQGTEVRAECMECSLHFAAFSWTATWMPRFCPECGCEDRFLVWKQPLEGQIYEKVPGSAELTAILRPKQEGGVYDGGGDRPT